MSEQIRKSKIIQKLYIRYLQWVQQQQLWYTSFVMKYCLMKFLVILIRMLPAMAYCFLFPCFSLTFDSNGSVWKKWCVIANSITIVMGIDFFVVLEVTSHLDVSQIMHFISDTCIEGVNFLTIVLPSTTTWVVLYQELKIHLTWDQL